MNNLLVKKVTQHFQDLVSEKKVKTFTKFLAEVNTYFKMSDVNRISYKFIYKELKNIHAFLKIIQHHPNSHLLTYALEPLYEFLLNNIIIPKIVYVADKKFFNVCKIKYRDLIDASREKRIFQVEGDMFVIPYKGNVSPQVREKVGLLPKKNWVFDFIAYKMERKITMSRLRYSEVLLNPRGWSDEQNFEFGIRLAADYFNSDSEYLPRELFVFEQSPDIPEGH